MIRIAIADDHTLLRNSLSLFVRNCKNMKVVLEAADGTALLNGLFTRKADIVLLDIRMPGMDGLKVLETLKSTYPDVRVIMISQYDDAGLIRQAFRLGAGAYLLKNSTTQELQTAIRRVMERGIFHTDLTRKYLNEQPGNSPGEERPFLPESLTSRELEILKMICNGLNSRDISERLQISSRTVESHKQAIYRKVGTDVLLELIRVAIRSGLISDVDLM